MSDSATGILVWATIIFLLGNGKSSYLPAFNPCLILIHFSWSTLQEKIEYSKSKAFNVFLLLNLGLGTSCLILFLNSKHSFVNSKNSLVI